MSLSDFVAACHGCRESPSAVLLDEGKPWTKCVDATFTFSSPHLLPAWVYGLSNMSALDTLGYRVRDYNYRYFKLQLLFKSMTRHANPAVRWFAKVDSDGWFNLIIT